MLSEVMICTSSNHNLPHYREACERQVQQQQQIRNSSKEGSPHSPKSFKSVHVWCGTSCVAFHGNIRNSKLQKRYRVCTCCTPCCIFLSAALSLLRSKIWSTEVPGRRCFSHTAPPLQSPQRWIRSMHLPRTAVSFHRGVAPRPCG